MFGKFSEQLQKSAQPAASLLEMNAKTLELVSKQQTVFFSGVVGDSVKLLSALSDQTELNGVLAAQSVYAESVRERLTSASKTTYSELNGLRAEITDIVKNSLENVSEETKAAFAKVQAQTTAPVAKAPAKKPVAKAAAKKEDAPSVKKAETTTKKTVTKKATVEATPKAAEKTTVAKEPVAKKPVSTKKVAAKAPAAKKPVAAKKAAPKAQPKATAKAEPKVAAKAEPKVVKTESQENADNATPVKTVAQLSPADVKAAGKK